MKWIGDGVLSVGGEDIKYGDDIPKGAIEKKNLNGLVKAGLVGEVPEKIDVEAIRQELVKELEASNEVLVKENESLKAENAKLKKDGKK